MKPIVEIRISYPGKPVQFQKQILWVNGIGGPEMSLYNMNVYLWNISNFAPVQIYDDIGEGGGVAMWQVLDPYTVSYVRSLQRYDPNWSTEQKITGWLYQKKGRIGWPDDRAGYVDQGAIVLGVNPVLVIGFEDYKTAAPNDVKRVRRVAITQGLLRSDMGRITKETHPYLLHDATCVYFPRGPVSQFEWLPDGFKYPNADLSIRSDRNMYFSEQQQRWLKKYGPHVHGSSPKGNVIVPYFHPNSDFPLSNKRTATPGFRIPIMWLCNKKEEAIWKWSPSDGKMPPA